MSLTLSELEHGHVGRSCMSGNHWHLTFSRKLTDEEWKKIKDRIALDPLTYDTKARDWNAERIADIIYCVTDVTMEYRKT